MQEAEAAIDSTHPTIQDSRHKKQWVSSVNAFSSEYNNTGWSAQKIIGTPQVYPNYGDQQNAWAQQTHLPNEFIELEYPNELIVTKINIYETYHAGAVVRIKLKNREHWETVWETQQPQDITNSRIFSPQLRRVIFKTKHIRLELDCSLANTWCEIDAVEMEGRVPLDALQCEEDLANDLKKLLQSSEFTDVKFEVEGKYIDAHRNILTARCTHFKNLLCDNLKADRLLKPIHIDGITYDAFKALLFYLYTNQIEKSSTDPLIVCELMRISGWYNIDNLSTTGFLHIEDILSIDNVISIYKCSSFIEPKLDGVAELCLDFITRHFQSIVNRDDFKGLSQPILVKITQYYAKHRSA